MNIVSTTQCGRKEAHMLSFTRKLERKNLEKEEQKRLLLENERKAREDQESLMSLEECRRFWEERFEDQNLHS